MKLDEVSYTMNKIPPAPPGWNKTIEDLLAEANRGERALLRGTLLGMLKTEAGVD